MIPHPRPGTRHGDCPNCGYRPDDSKRSIVWCFDGVPIPEMTNEALLAAYTARLTTHGPITEADGLLMSELVRRGLRLHP
jgi:hypothetical protein